MSMSQEDTILHWFGEPWNAPFIEDCPRQETPIGVPCYRCHQPIEAQDRGVTMYALWGTERAAAHLDCFERSVTGKWPADQTHRKYTYEATPAEREEWQEAGE